MVTNMATLTSMQRRNVVLFAASLGSVKPTFKRVTRDGSEVLEVRGMPVFRTGTFRDSLGLQHTWERLHVQQMIANFNALRESHVFEDVPVRRDHTSYFGSNLDTVIGYHVGLSAKEFKSPVSGADELYLLADYDILDPSVFDKIESGLWRNRSAEIGTYLTNNETEYWPTYQGFGYVDIPAVEGLNAYAKSMGAGDNFSFMTESQEDLVPEKTTDPAGTDTEHGKPATPPVPAPQPHTFSIGGQTTSDFGKVQAHIAALEATNTGLEQFKKESIEAARGAFVKGLADTNKLPATMIAEMTEFAKGLSEEQYAAWQKPYETASSIPVLSPQGSEGQHSNGTSSASGGPENPDADRIDVLKQIVANHKAANMSTVNLEKTSSFLELQALLAKTNK